MAFIDRVVEHPGRVRLTMVEEDVYDVAREEGTVVEEGTPLDAEHLNAEMEAAVEDRLIKLNFSSLSDMETQWGSLKTSTIYAFHATAEWTNAIAPLAGAYQANGTFMPVSGMNADFLFAANGHLWFGRHTKGSPVLTSNFTKIL